ncbi:MBL fold metallo-hydrolase [Orenia metallireducens]|uniref:MBL fold metallo-hydrolase n=1 Tax=Orenia metallireducens TaxID=1413210 RepID=UPI002480147D|nr:MBL fold metallo-hydrolase [Orenia metallireducens]
MDVGQADSTLVELPNGENMLIDAGNNDAGNLIVNYIRNLNISKIDYLIGTHPHEDHIGGLDNVISSLNISKIYMPKVTHTTKTFKDVLLAAKRKNLSITPARAGLNLISNNNLKVDIIAPIGTNYHELNNWSAVIKVTYQDTSFLFTGDAEVDSEHEILALGVDLHSNILKVGHHGSASSTTALFLRKINPKYAIISVGQDNKYGHPDPIIINRLNLHGVKIYRTDRQGTILAISDGKKIKFNTVPIAMTDTNNNSGSKIRIASVDLKKEIVKIQNTHESTIDISGWKLVSVKGGQSFIFPPATIIKAGAIIKITSGKNAKSGPNNLKWTDSYIWNNDGDPARLYDKDGKLVGEY